MNPLKQSLFTLALTALLITTAHAQTPIFTPGKIVVLRGGDGILPFSSTNKQNPAFLDEYDPVLTNQANPIISVEMPTNNGNASLWFNASAGSEGQGLNRSTDRRYLLMTGYTSPVDLSKNQGPPSTYGFNRGFGTIDAFTNLNVVYSDQYNWFGLAPGVTQNNPRGICSLDGTNFWGCGTVAGTASGGYQESGCLFYNPTDPALDTGNGLAPVAFESILSSAYCVQIRNNTLYALAKAKDGYLNGLYTFNTLDGNPDPLPWLPGTAQRTDTTNLYCNFGAAYKSVVSFDMDNSNSIIYIADQTLGIAKFVNNGGVWSQAYLFNTNNLGTTNFGAGIGVFALAVDFTYATTNYPVIYAVTMEMGDGVNVDSNRLVRIVDIGNPGTTARVAQTLAVADGVNEDFRGITFAPDLTPLITTQPVGFSTVTNVTVTFNVTASSAYPLTYQWLKDGTSFTDDSNITGSTSTNLTFLLTSLTNSGNYSVVVSNQYGAVTSSIATLVVSSVPVLPSTNAVIRLTNFIGDNVSFSINLTNGTQPFSFAWYFGSTALVDDGIKYSGSPTSSLSITNVQLADSGNYFLTVSNSAGAVTNQVTLTVQYLKPIIPGGSQPASIVMLQGQTNSLPLISRGTAPLSFQWYKGKTGPAVPLADTGEFSGSASAALTITGAVVGDATNYFCVITNVAGSITSQLASVTVIVPPALSSLGYSNQVYFQNFDSLPDAGGIPVNTAAGGPVIIGQNGSASGITYWPSNPYDFAFPTYINITAGASGGLGLGNTMAGWYAECDSPQALGGGLIGAHDGSQTTGGAISFGKLDGTHANRALGLIATSGSGPTHFGLKLINNSTNELHYINLNYVGEYWKLGSHPKALDFGYAVNAAGNNSTLSSDVIAIATNNFVPSLSIVTNVFPLAAAGPSDGSLPSNQTNLAAGNLPLSTAWLPGQTLWLVWSINDFSGSGQGYGIDNLSFSASVAPITTLTMGDLAFNSTGTAAGLKLNFTNSPGAAGQFTIWGTTNLVPAVWHSLGHPTESAAGLYQFIDSAATNRTQQFYKATSP